VLGDKWSLLIIRDMMFGNRRHFRELLNKSEEGISSNILSDRLKTLLDEGINQPAADEFAAGFLRPLTVDRTTMFDAERAGLSWTDMMAANLDLQPAIAARGIVSAASFVVELHCASLNKDARKEIAAGVFAAVAIIMVPPSVVVLATAGEPPYQTDNRPGPDEAKCSRHDALRSGLLHLPRNGICYNYRS
jgi:hypothetical protein